MKKTILIADDDSHIRDVIKFALEKSGMESIEAEDGSKVLSIVKKNNNIDLIILDINMPEVDGLEVCKILRKSSEIPILFLSSRDEEIDRVVGIEIGADDYVVKPFSTRELIARVNAILKRSTPTNAKVKNDKDVYCHGLLSLDTERHQIIWNKEVLNLTAREFTIVKGFISRPERVMDRDAIIEQAYGQNSFVSDRTIDSHIRHIRNKFLELGCDSVFETVHGVGYKLGKCQ